MGFSFLLILNGHWVDFTTVLCFISWEPMTLTLKRCPERCGSPSPQLLENGVPQSPAKDRPTLLEVS